MAAVCREGRSKSLVHVILNLYPEEYASYVDAFYQEDKKRERRRNLEEVTWPDFFSFLKSLNQFRALLMGLTMSLTDRDTSKPRHWTANLTSSNTPFLCSDAITGPPSIRSVWCRPNMAPRFWKIRHIHDSREIKTKKKCYPGLFFGGTRNLF